MKWKTYVPPPPPEEPAWGERRSKIIFALVPHACTDGKTRWLEKVHRFEEYSRSYFGIHGCFGLRWEVTRYEGVN